MSLTLVSMIGARPQFIKSAVVSRALQAAGIIEHVVHSGQHYDHAMSGQFLTDLGIDVAANLEAGSGSHAHQTGTIMMRFQEYLDSLPAHPDGIVVYGDTNSTVAAALVAAKEHIPLIHVEAGLRSYNRAMPEEVNRVMTDHLSALLLCSSDEGEVNLRSEGIINGVHVVGDVMYDAFAHFSAMAPRGQAFDKVLGKGHRDFALMTLHRPANTDDPAFLPRLAEAARGIAMPIIWPVHPRFRAKVEAVADTLPANLHRIEPVGYFDMLDLLHSAAHVLTDSGGLQKEAYWAQTPCITLRTETEWVETLTGDWNMLANLTDDLPGLMSRVPSTPWAPLYGDGQASARIAQVVKAHLKGA